MRRRLVRHPSILQGEQLTPDAVSHRPPAAQGSDVTALQGLRVLMIDPNEEHQVLAVTTLGRAGSRVDVATTGRDGLRLARRNRYDAIVIDHRLRDVSGFHVLRALNDIGPNTPRIYVAAAGSESVAIRAVERGATGYLLKTANFFELLPLEIEQQIAKMRLRLEAERQREALEESEERYRAFFERARDPVFVVDSAGRFLALNRALCEFTGYEREELLRMKLFDLLLPASGTGTVTFSDFHETFEEGPLEFGVRRKDGSIAYVDVTSRLVQQGSLVAGVEGIARDVTAKRAAERALQRVYARLAAVYNASEDGILVADESGLVVEANPKVVEILDVRDGGITGRRAAELLRTFGERTRDPGSWSDRVERAAREPEAALACDVEVLRPRPRVFEHRTGPIRGTDGGLAGRVWMFHEVTSERAALRDLEESERRYRELYRQLEAIFNATTSSADVFGRDAKGDKGGKPTATREPAQGRRTAKGSEQRE